jgi:hypothetical protein
MHHALAAGAVPYLRTLPSQRWSIRPDQPSLHQAQLPQHLKQARQRQASRWMDRPLCIRDWIGKSAPKVAMVRKGRSWLQVSTSASSRQLHRDFVARSSQSGKSLGRTKRNAFSSACLDERKTTNGKTRCAMVIEVVKMRKCATGPEDGSRFVAALRCGCFCVRR